MKTTTKKSSNSITRPGGRAQAKRENDERAITVAHLNFSKSHLSKRLLTLHWMVENVIIFGISQGTLGDRIDQRL